MSAAKRRIGPEAADAPTPAQRTTRARKPAGSRSGTKTHPAETPGETRSVDREALIRQAAYFRAESRGFAGGSPEQDWLDAEAEVDRKQASERSST